MDVLRLYVITYNVATKSPEGKLLEILGLPENVNQKTNLPDFYLIGLQEVKSQPHNYVIDALFDDPWTNAFRQALIPYGYVKARTVRLVGLVLSVFCLRKHVVHLRDMESRVTRTGLMGFWGNKGGVTLRLQVYGCSLCFVNSHFAAHDHLLKERISDYNTVLNSQGFSFSETTSILFHDYVFWFGDFNFRLNNSDSLKSPDIDQKVKTGNLASLLEQDQLKAVMVSGEAFSELKESEISFPPTYKYKFQSNEYDLGRRPAWTDRILYKVNANVYENITLEAEQESYSSIQNFSVSDHKPVVGLFSVKVFCNYAERVVKFLPIQSWYTNQENLAHCIMGSDVTPSPYDWVGIYRDDFTSLDEYYGFVYVMRHNGDSGNGMPGLQIPCPKPGDRLELRFYENIIRFPRKYRLLYFSHDSGSVLGMSSSFELKVRDRQASTHLDW
ncbi:inositol polyphosphate 5-phosphatase K-like [Halyomorpha halys]|uniref:inositol polyphosphate 5-phosphatase K-like n=1 Tax=Halyomorpha halys TaxID=286706 RepID=UPI0006D506C2|nr:inositol polyphosphate 5-phosphatase K-like [Halyomorpha halys]